MIDVTTFALRPGTDEAGFLATDAAAQTGLWYHQSGLLRRTTARAESDRWAVITVWTDAESASAAEVATKGHPLRVALDDLLLPGTSQTQQFFPLP